VLGLLGLLLGSAGIGMVVLRNTLERRAELAIVRAVGFSGRATRWLVLSEHGTLLALGLAWGGVAALVALIPGTSGAGASPSLAPTAGMLLLVAASGALWTWCSTTLALRGELLSALRGE
jgi:ABC-type antimicrobial peptide transport system permease subunit